MINIISDKCLAILVVLLSAVTVTCLLINMGTPKVKTWHRDWRKNRGRNLAVSGEDIREVVHQASQTGMHATRLNSEPVLALIQAVDARASIDALRGVVQDQVIKDASGVDPLGLYTTLQRQQRTIGSYVMQKFPSSCEEEDAPPLMVPISDGWVD